MNLLAVILILAQVSGASLAETLRAVEEGADIAVPREVGVQAVKALSQHEAMSPEQVDLHLQVAIKAGAFRELAGVTPALLASDGAALEPTLRAIGRLDARERRLVLARVQPAAVTRFRVLDGWALEDAAAARGAILVAVPACTPNGAADLLRRIASERPDRALSAAEALTASPPSRELLDALVSAESDLPPSVASALGPALASLADRDPALVGPLAEAISSQPSLALLGAVGAIPPEQSQPVGRTAMQLVTALSGEASSLTRPEVDLLVAAINAAGELRLPELLFALPGLCQPSLPLAVRVSALRALGAVGAREAGTVDLLIGHLSEDEPLASAAYEALIRRSGAKMPQRASVWQEWRARTKLVEMTPAEHTERLRAEHAAVYRARRSELRRAMRD